MSQYFIFTNFTPKVKLLDKVLGVVVVFCFIFSFNIPIIKNSIVLSCLLSFLGLALKKRVSIKNSLFVYKNRYTIFCLSYLLLLGFCTYLAIIFSQNHAQAGFSLPRIVQCIYLFLVLIPLVYLNNSNISLKTFLEFILYAFAIQSLIQLIAFISPSFLNIVQFFQPDNITEKSENYGGIRGLALAGNVFFALASIYGLAMMVFVYYISTFKGTLWKSNVLFFLLLCLGGMFTGRTFFIGLGFALMLYFLLNYNKPSSYYIALKSLMIIILSATCFAFLFIPIELLDKIINELLPFVFEFIYSYLETGSFSTRSTDHLTSMLSVPLTINDFAHGQARYINIDGSYFMHTDSGYFRQILFWGLPGLLLVIIFHLGLFFIPFLQNRKPIYPNYKVFISTLFIYTVILQIKGEVFAHMHFMSIIIFTISLIYIRDSKRFHDQYRSN
ncbi:hypothetical protein [Colwellia piezophila]|uniref:hypothetical protein n=1 Tax=Colwellia piezophila TaxID=211668 RepID=UPI0003649893|nr:hypothetical protein [Colwellia piezophila]